MCLYMCECIHTSVCVCMCLLSVCVCMCVCVCVCVVYVVQCRFQTQVEALACTLLTMLLHFLYSIPSIYKCCRTQEFCQGIYKEVNPNIHVT